MSEPLTPGSLIAGYRIDELVGRGGMGVVYRATELALDRPVALKLIAPELAGNTEFRARFLHETRLAASIDHPGILPVYATGEAGGELYLATRYVEGTDLRRMLADGPLPVERALAIVGQIAEALDAAHARGLVHRDVKPANILVDAADHAYLCDFGLTKAGGTTSTVSGLVVGTLDYLAPEQIRGELVEGPADQYALAAVLYECLAGRPAFRRATEAQTLWAHMQEPPPELSVARQDLPPALDGVIGRGLAKTPEERFASCVAFLDEARAAAGLGVSPAVVRRRRRLGRRLALAGAVVLGLAVAAAALALTFGSDDPLTAVPNSVVAVDPATNRVVAVVPVGNTPTRITATEEAVWVLNANDGAGTISRIDARTKRASAPFSVSGTPRDLLAAAGSLWVGTGEGRLFRLDPISGLVDESWTLRNAGRSTPFDYNPGAGWLAYGARTVFAASLRTISRIDPETSSVTPLASRAYGPMVFGFGSLWVMGENGLVRLAPTSAQERANVGLATYSESLAAGLRSVWLAGTEVYEGVFEVDPVHEVVAGTVRIGGRGYGVATGHGAVWATSDAGEVIRIDPDTGTSRAIRVGGTPRAVAVGAGHVWVSVN